VKYSATKFIHFFLESSRIVNLQFSEIYLYLYVTCSSAIASTKLVQSTKGKKISVHDR